MENGSMGRRGEGSGRGVWSRREFLSRLPAGAAAAGLLGAVPAAGSFRAVGVDGAVRVPAGGAANNIIVMVSDGMSAGTLTIAEIYSRRVLGRGTRWAAMLADERARRAVMTTHSADSLVTDSAAAASAWGSGVKVKNNAVNYTPQGESPEPILVTAARSGRATGLVTTTRVTHATPAGFIANVPHRDLEDDIARQVVERGVDVVLGGGAKHFPHELTAGREGLRVYRDLGGLIGAGHGEGRAFGLFTMDHMSYEIDRPEREPSLAEMTSAALARLGRGTGRGFVLQVEGGRVDHAAHNNDAAALVRDQLAFDDALGVGLDFIAGRADTLLIVTTDHGNANPGLTVYRGRGERGIEQLAMAKRSFDWIAGELSKIRTPEARASAAAEIVQEATGIGLKGDEASMLRRTVMRERVDAFLDRNAVTSVIGSLLSNFNGVGFVSANHTGDVVELTALGPGSELIRPWMDNTQLYGVLLSAAGLPVAGDGR